MFRHLCAIFRERPLSFELLESPKWLCHWDVYRVHPDDTTISDFQVTHCTQVTVCMYVRVCMYVYMYIYLCMYVCLYVRVYL
jgi:hypothetical protein